MTVYGQNQDGTWTEVAPLPPQGPIARAEWWLRDRGHARMAHALGWLDELPLRWPRR